MSLRILASCSLLTLAVACDSGKETGDTGDTDTADTDTGADTSDTGTDTGDSGDTDTGDTDTGDTDTADTGDTGTASLYDQIGGAPAVSAVVDAFLARVGADSRINWFFADSDMAGLKTKLEEQICAATGGPCTYTGGSMVDVHAGMAITDAQFDALVEDLLLALDDLGVPYALDGSQPIDPLLVALVGMRGDIVTDADGSAVTFNQIGGYAAVGAVVDGLLANVAADSRINWFFADSDMTTLRTRLVEQVCSATGGYCTYKGGSMVDVHAGMAITNAQFDALVEDLLAALDTLGVPYALDGSEAIDPLLIALVGMQADIVTDADGTAVNFNAIGGHAALEAVVDEFLVIVAADSRINARFASTDLAALDLLLVEQMCDATGGYCTYSGMSMYDAHHGMNVTEDEFDYLVEDLLTACDNLGVVYALDGSQPIDALLLALVGMETDIVGH